MVRGMRVQNARGDGAKKNDNVSKRGMPALPAHPPTMPGIHEPIREPWARTAMLERAAAKEGDRHVTGRGRA
jgi:hypothetical protein